YGTEIPTLNILNAIDWTAESWKNVTDDVIYRCWERTGILPVEEMTSNNLVDDNSEIEDEDIQLLIDQMNDDIGIIRARDYIEIDNNLRTGIIDINLHYGPFAHHCWHEISTENGSEFYPICLGMTILTELNSRKFLLRMSFALQYQEKQIYNKHVLFAIARDSPMIHVYQARYWILLKN
ncbi:2228_t:CDS:2, partial [Entrophospora sp. SA101]